MVLLGRTRDCSKMPDKFNCKQSFFTKSPRRRANTISFPQPANIAPPLAKTRKSPAEVDINLCSWERGSSHEHNNVFSTSNISETLLFLPGQVLAPLSSTTCLRSTLTSISIGRTCYHALFQSHGDIIPSFYNPPPTEEILYFVRCTKNHNVDLWDVLLYSYSPLLPTNQF